jgi:integrase
MRAALRIAAILFQRPGNLRTMRWADLNLDAGLWHIPSEDMKRTKVQKINGQAHTSPMPKQVMAVLAELHPTDWWRRVRIPPAYATEKPRCQKLV